MTKKMSVCIDLGLAAAFLLLYYVNAEIAKCIYLEQGWDIGIVNAMARYMSEGTMIGTHEYYAIYPNNVPISYILCRLYELAKKIPDYQYSYEFFWILVNCGMISVSGFTACMTVKKVTANPVAVLTAFVLYVGCVCVTPWKTAAYTDMYAIMFPILCICVYLYYSQMKSGMVRHLLWFLILVLGFFGALIKPSVLVIVIAIVGIEIVKNLTAEKSRLIDLGVHLMLLVLTIILYYGYQQHIYNETEFVCNENAAVTIHHYLLMGINEERTGSYDSGVLAFHGRFANPEERIPAQWEEYFRQLKERGMAGHIRFLLKKMVMTFNDGAFGWGREGNFEYFSYPIFSNAWYSPLLRDVFWPDFMYSGYFNTYSQFIWLVILGGIPGCCFYKKKDRHITVTIILAILGVFLYLLLFETRARYLICFLPVLITASAVGMTQYYEWFIRGVGKVKSLRQQAARSNDECDKEST